MNPYLVCWRLFIPEDCVQTFGQWKCGDKGTFEGTNCMSRFFHLLVKMMAADDSRKIIILAWNGRKFDSQFLIEKFFSYYPFDTELIGTVTNPKSFTVGNKRLEMWDAMDMVSPMSL